MARFTIDWPVVEVFESECDDGEHDARQNDDEYTSDVLDGNTVGLIVVLRADSLKEEGS